MYISSVCITLLSENHDSFHQVIHSEGSQSVILRFCSDSNAKILIVSKRGLKEEKDKENAKKVEEPNIMDLISFSLEMNSTKATSHSIAFVKRQCFVLAEEASAYSRLLQVINLGFYAHDSSPISVNHLYVQNCFLPIFNAYRTHFEAK